jgi:hypothetical protein
MGVHDGQQEEYHDFEIPNVRVDKMQDDTPITHRVPTIKAATDC